MGTNKLSWSDKTAVEILQSILFDRQQREG